MSLINFFFSNLFEFYPYVYKDCNDFILNVLELKKKEYFFPWVIIENKTGHCIGSTSCALIDFNHKKCEMGWTWFGQNFQGNGYNIEAKLLLLNFLFEKENFNRVEFKAGQSA